MATNWNQRFFASTRGRIITLLRRANRTVDELAHALGLTDNAVRAHLNTLERDGFVQQRGARRGNSKPSYVYDLTPAAEQLYPKAYGAVLQQLLEVLSSALPSEEMETILRETGRQIASRWSNPSDELQERLQVAVNVLNELGGMAELERSNGNYCIQGYSCPLAAAAQDHPEICHLAESLLTELVGIPVQEQCEHGKTLHCRFVVSAS
ncbi:MAG TPA: ArsR family transcriptional regulator [Ktedonobacteraceae bacterium]|nr:ArsR family transcriptional regulator [Ktedonobacteraceae bacterium]